MSPKPQGKQSEKKKNPVKVKFPAVVSWTKDRYWGLDDAAFTLPTQPRSVGVQTVSCPTRAKNFLLFRSKTLVAG